MRKNKYRGPIDDAEKQRAEEFDQAVERVFRHYENDLSAFIRDVQRNTAKNAAPVQSQKSSRE
jgi:hypothetical protein